MKLERSKNTARGFVFGSLNRVYGMLLPFVMRTVIIYVLGMEYVGLNSLFTSVLSVLNIAELGVGSALVFSMYEPLANDDKPKICALMKLYRKYYRIIGLVILIAGMAIVPVLPKLVKGDVPDDLNLYVLYFLNLGTTVISYWLFAYKNCLLAVHQRQDILSKIAMAIDTVKCVLQIFFIFAFKSYYYYLVVGLLMGVVNNILTAYIVHKKYPEYSAKGSLPASEIRDINQRVKDLFLTKIGATVVDSSDALVISAFLGLTILAQYQNYYFILGAVFGFTTIIVSSSLAGIGNSLVTDTKVKNYNDFLKMTFLFSWISCFAIPSLACLYQPFIKLWVGEENMLPYGMVIIICVYFFVKQVNSLLNTYKDAAGIWHSDRFRPLITGLLNLGLNLIMVHYIGLYGILISTIASMLLVGIPWLLINVFKNVFMMSPKEYLKKLFIYAILVTFLTGLCYLICNSIHFDSLIITFLIRLIICTIVTNGFMLFIYRKTSEFQYTISVIDKLTKGKIRLLKKVKKYD